MKQTWPAAERNKQPILEVLRRVFPATARVLEIASGSGQHAVYFGAQLPGMSWQPTDVDPVNLASIAAWRDEAGLANLAPVRVLDVRDAEWGMGEVDAIFNANMIHIAPWECAEGLMRGAGRHLVPRGVLAIYGPFRLAGAHTAESNAAFDASLRQRNPAWGVRDVEALTELGARAQLVLEERVPMPSNNQMLVFRKQP